MQVSSSPHPARAGDSYMRPFIVAFVLLWLGSAFYGAWPPWLRIAGQAPDFVLATVACLGLYRGAVAGCGAGLAGALFIAGAGHVPMGGLSLGLMLVGTGAGLLRGSLFSERIFVAVVCAILGVAVAGLIRLVVIPPPGLMVWLRDTAATMLLTGIATPPIFALARLAREQDSVI